MLRRDITYTNFDGVEVTDTLYFNLSKSELILWQTSENGGLAEKLQKMLNQKDGKLIMQTFYDILLKSYGEKSADGRRFIKSDELSKAFSETPAFDILFSELLSDPEKALLFVRQVMPPEFQAQLDNVGAQS